MRTFPDCYACLFQQSLNAMRPAGLTVEREIAALRQILGLLAATDPSLSPAHLLDLINPIVCAAAGVDDPYRAARLAGLEVALSGQQGFRELVAKSADPFETATRLAIAGNIIDVIPGHTYDLWAVVRQALAQPIAGDGLEEFRAAVASARSILYLADNAGEAVFDRFLVEQIGKPVHYAVKSGPILNDATLEDALAAGLDSVAQIVATGSVAAGTILEKCSPEFLEIFQAADLIIAKGQGNYETLDMQGERVFFLMKVKCPIIARQIGASVGDLLIRHNRPLQKPN